MRLPGGERSTATAPNAGDMVKMQYPNSDVLDVLHLYGELTGKKLVMDNNVQGKVNIFLSKPVPRDEAVQIIEMNLSLNGFSLVPTEGDIIEVVGVNKNPRAAAVPIISDPADLPAGAKVVSYLFKLNYADPQELQTVLQQYLTGIGGQAPILSLPKSSSLLVTQSSDVLRKVVKIVEQLDVAPAEVVSEFIKLERADAAKVVDMLKDVFEKGDQAGQPGQPRIGRNIRGVVPMPPGQQMVEGDEGGTALLSEDSLVVGKIKIEADVRTNRIHVITRPINMPFVRDLIAQFDANVEFGKPVTRPLKYIAAGDVLDVLVQALTEPGAENQQGQTGANTQQNRQQNRNPTSPTNPNSNTATGVYALQNNDSGNNNTACGYQALLNNTTGSFNVAIGNGAGGNLTTGINNIDIGNTGVAGESKTIRIGKPGTHQNAYIAGVNGVTVAGGIGVIVDSNGHLGTTTSSARYKENIQPMDKASEAILSLQPVIFRYKKELDPAGIPQFGLVAEQVEKVNPDLVARDEQGKPYTVRYEAVNAMLLNEFLKEHRKVEEQGREIAELKERLDQLSR